MAYKIKKTKGFVKNTVTILSYIEKEWSLQASQKFQKILDSKIDSICNNPNIGSCTLKNINVRKFTVTKHNKIYYQIKVNAVILLSLFETKQNPKNNKYE